VTSENHSECFVQLHTTRKSDKRVQAFLQFTDPLFPYPNPGWLQLTFPPVKMSERHHQMNCRLLRKHTDCVKSRLKCLFYDQYWSQFFWCSFMFTLKQNCGGCVLSEPRGWTRPYVSQQAACCGPSSEFKHLRASISTIRLPTQERELTAVGNMQQACITLHQGSQTRGMSISTTRLSLSIISMVLSISLSTI